MTNEYTFVIVRDQSVPTAVIYKSCFFFPANFIQSGHKTRLMYIAQDFLS